MPRSIGDDMALAALDLLAGIEAPWTAGFGGLDRLAVDHSGGGAGLAAGGLARLHDQLMIDPLPDAVVAPGVEEALHRREGRIAVGQQPPLTTARRDVEQGIHHRPKIGAPGPTEPPWPRQMWRYQPPLLIRRIA